MWVGVHKHDAGPMIGQRDGKVNRHGCRSHAAFRARDHTQPWTLFRMGRHSGLRQRQLSQFSGLVAHG
jgi:hypothetical protein